jgi:hypothetical protein
LKEYTYTPQISGIKGSLLLKVPSYVERLKIIKEQGIGLTDANNIDIDNVIKMFELAQKYILKVDIEMGKEKIKDLEELGMYQKGVEVINGAVGILAGGIPSEGKA